jgi:sugar O-acyltransferase (sialic acid O-acetyltransferase NeuD family)
MIKQNLILVGGGRFGREVASWIDILALPYQVLGHIDDEKTHSKVIGTILDHEPRNDALYLTCFGSGPARHKVRMSLEAKGARFANVIDPQVRTASSLEGLKNCILLGTLGISNDVSLGSDLLIHAFASIGHDVTIGDGVTIGSHGFVGGGATLGENCTIHPNAVVLPDITVGPGAIVGAGSVAVRNVPANTTVFGSPAKVIAFGNPDA